jgi:16S rRNA (cytidine1402-2'-O)-methyltransferase
MSYLYMAAVPIGNLEDITHRALRALQECDFIACEDTRHSSKLLNHFGIHKPLFSCHSHNEDTAVKRIVAELDSGRSGVYISDAGSPGVSDPGGKLSLAAFQAGHKVSPLPGPSALTALISVLGMPGKSILFEGFLSPKSGRRQNQIRSALERADIVILYESPFRILALLSDINAVSSDAQVVVGRELSKIHEEVLRGNALEIAQDLEQRDAVRGEFVMAVRGQVRPIEKNAEKQHKKYQNTALEQKNV